MDEERKEHMSVAIMRMMPDRQVSSVFAGVLISGEDGLGKEARAEPLPTDECWVWIPVTRDQPAVGKGGGAANMDVKRLP
jgi:hypothetical protein